MSAKDELAKKRERLAELRRAKTERASTSAAAASPQQPSLEEVLAAAGIKSGDEGNTASPAPSQPTFAQTPAKTPAADGGGVGERRKLTLSISEAVLVEVPGKTLETYDKVIQTEVTEEDAKDDDETPLASVIPAAPVSEEGDKDEDAENNVDGGDEATTTVVEVMSEAEWSKVADRDDFKDFFFRSSKVMERALGQQGYDILKDYSTDDASNQAGEETLSATATFSSDKLTADRPITNVEWSMHHPELVLASYHNPMSREGETLGGAEGLVCIWNLRAGQQTEPEYHLRCQSAATCAIVNRYSAHCYVGGTMSGQVVLWDVRAQRTPVARTPLSAGGHTHPVVKVSIVGTHHAHSLLSLSNDAKLSTWTLTKLSEPLESVTLHDGGASDGPGMSVTAMAFSDSDVDGFMVGCEDGAVWSGSRKGIASSGAGKGKLGEQMEGHFAPITSLHIHPSSQETFQADLSHLALSASMDYSCMLWDRRAGKQMVNLEVGGSEYVQDCQWSPTNLSLMAACDAGGFLHLWDLSLSLEGPIAQTSIPAGTDGQRGLNALGWAVEGKHVAAGDSEGKLHVMTLRSEASEARPDALDNMYAALASSGQYDPAEIRSGGGAES